MNEGLQFEWRLTDKLRALNLKGFEYARLIGKFYERMTIYTKCARIESQREEIKLGIWNWLGKKMAIRDSFSQYITQSERWP